MARLGSQLTLIYHLFVVFTFFSSPFFANTAAPVVFVSARELHREQALARAQQRWEQRVSYPQISNFGPEFALLGGPSDPHIPWPLAPTPTHRESHRFSSPYQTSVPSRTKSAPLNRITSSPGEHDDPSPLHRRYIEKRALCPFDSQTIVVLYFLSGAQFPFSSTTTVGPRSTGIPGDNLDRLVDTTVNPKPNPTVDTTIGGGNYPGKGGPPPNGALLAGIFSILALIVLAFVLTVWYHYRNRRARKIAAAGQIEGKKDGATIVREMGSKGFATLRSSPPPSKAHAFLRPGNMVDRAMTAWGHPSNNQDSRYSKASDDSELREWKMSSGMPRSMQRESDFTVARNDEVYPTITRDRIGGAGVEESSAPGPIPASPSLDFQFPRHHTSVPSVSDSSHSPSAAEPAFTIPRVPVRYETNILYATSPEVLRGTATSLSEGSEGFSAAPPTRTLPVDERPLSQPRSNLTGATSASRSISPRRATTTTATTSISPTFFKRTSSPPRSVSPPLQDSNEGALSPRARMAGFRLTPASQLETRIVGEAGQEVGKGMSTPEELFASGSYRAGTSSNLASSPSGASSIPFPRESLQFLPIRRPPRRDETSESQARENQRKMTSRRIVQLAMASPGALVSEESFSTTSQGMPDMYEGVAPRSLGAPTNEGSYPPGSSRPEHFRDDSHAATTEMHQRRFSTKSYPYAGLIALHAPTARPLSVSSKAKSPISLGRLSLSAETDYGNTFGGQSKQTSRVASFSSSQYLYGYHTTNVDGGRSLRSSRRSSMSALSLDPTASPWRQRNPSLGSSGRAGARASFGPTNKAEAAQRAAALVQLTSGVRRDRQVVPTKSPTPPP